MNLTQVTIVNDFLKLGFTILSLYIVVISVGRLFKTERGFKIEKAFDEAVDQIPVISTVYSVVKVSLDTLFTGPEEFQKPVTIDLNGLNITGFKTGNKTADGKDIIFVPTAPNITSGFVVELEEERYEESDKTVQEALTKILSAGLGSVNKEDEPTAETNQKED